METSESAVKKYFTGKSVFITGATGFCGRVFLEKILRSLPDLDKVYLLIRPKKGMTPKQRKDQLFAMRVFSFFPPSEKVKNKVVVVEGDISSDGLSLSSEDRQMLREKVNVVYHLAASVRFDATFRTNLNINAMGTLNIIKLCHEMRHLECFIHLSTAYSNCQVKLIEERIYELPKNVDELLSGLSSLDDEELEKVAPKYFEGRPNSYIFTKAMAELIIEKHRGQIPTAIIRPSIVASSLEEPVPGWNDSFIGVAGFSMVGSLGIAQITDWDFDRYSDGMPVDILSNAMIAMPHFTLISEERKREVKIYNLTSTTIRPLHNHTMMRKFFKEMQRAPSMYVIRPLYLPAMKHNMSKLEYKIKIFFYHILFAYFIDFILMLCGQKRLMVRAVKKMHYSMDIMKYFGINEWRWKCENYLSLIDYLNENKEKEFNVDIRQHDVEKGCRDFWLGVRRYLLKEDDSTILLARIKYKIQLVFYRLYQLFLLYLFLKLLISYTPIGTIVGELPLPF